MRDVGRRERERARERDPSRDSAVFSVISYLERETLGTPLQLQMDRTHTLTDAHNVVGTASVATQ